MLVARMMCAVGLLCAVSASASEGEGYWLPDQKTVEHIEEAIRHMAPPAQGGEMATSLDTYGRYYAGITVKGHKVVYGVFLSMDPAAYPRGIHIVPFEGQPRMSGGGCSQLNVWFDVAEQRVTEFHCYGLG
jgi:hypothetical protein